MWRLDKNWKGLRREIPWTIQPPSEYIRQFVRFTTQPVDAPSSPKHVQQIIDQLGSDDLLLYATDYPHWHADEDEPVEQAGLPVQLSPERTAKILSENARAWYRLPAAVTPGVA
jgi:predicted TIM-barrel fold metal-dependent hydrolase